MKKYLVFLCLINASSQAEKLSPNAQALSKKLQEIFKQTIARPPALSFLSTDRLPGVRASFVGLQLPFPLLRKMALSFLEKIEGFARSSNWVNQIKSLFKTSFPYSIEMRRLRWANGLPSPETSDSLDALEKSFRKANFVFEEGNRRLLAGAALPFLNNGKKSIISRSLSLTQFTPLLVKLGSFYGLDPHPDDLYEYLEKLLQKEPNLVLSFSSVLDFPDILKQTMLKMKRPSLWPQKDVDKFKFEFDKMLNSAMPWEQLLPSLIHWLEEDGVTPSVLEEILTKGTTSQPVRYRITQNLQDLAYLYKNLPQPQFEKADKIFKFLETNPANLGKYGLYDYTLALHLATMYATGRGTPVDLKKAFTYFQKVIEYPDGFKKFLPPDHRLPNLLATFVYWFDIPIPDRLKKRELSNEEMFEVFRTIVNQSSPIENAFLQLYIDPNLLFVWDLLYQAFHSKK